MYQFLEQLAIYVLGKNKKEILKKVLTGPYRPDEFPAQKVGTPEHKALFIVDQNAFDDFS